MALVGCDAPGSPPPPTVQARDYDAFWLWAGVRPHAHSARALERAKTLYLLAAEIKVDARGMVHVADRRAGAPRLPHQQLWMVYRTDTLAWSAAHRAIIRADIARWRAAGNNVKGVQIDFDAATKGLDGYAAFLRTVRADLPPDTALGVTGLMDWVTGADPSALNTVGRTVDEVVFQTYQGRQTVGAVDHYLAGLDRLTIPFKLGLVEGGAWAAPAHIARHPHFRGYVVFLVNDPQPAHPPKSEEENDWRGARHALKAALKRMF